MASRRKSKPKPKPKRWLPEWEVDQVLMRRGLVWTGWVAAAGVVITGWVLGVPRLEAYASSQPPAEVAAVFKELPSWVDKKLEADLLAIALQLPCTDPLLRDDLVAARTALLATGWFEGIDQVRRVNAELVEIDARFFRPFALIRDSSGKRDHLVDVRARLMPRSFAVGATKGLAAITGTRYDKPTQPGEPWRGEDITAALKVLHAIRDRPWRGQVASVDVSAYHHSSSIRLITDRGCAVLWGRAPGDERGGEVPAEQKIRYLDYHDEHYGHIDRGFLQELDVTGDVVIGR